MTSVSVSELNAKPRPLRSPRSSAWFSMMPLRTIATCSPLMCGCALRSAGMPVAQRVCAIPSGPSTVPPSSRCCSSATLPTERMRCRRASGLRIAMPASRNRGIRGAAVPPSGSGRRYVLQWLRRYRTCSSPAGFRSGTQTTQSSAKSAEIRTASLPGPPGLVGPAATAVRSQLRAVSALRSLRFFAFSGFPYLLLLGRPLPAHADLLGAGQRIFRPARPCRSPTRRRWSHSRRS